MRDVFWSAIAGAAVLALLLATSPILPMAWDEGNAIGRAANIVDWTAQARERGLAAFSREEIGRHWHYTVEIEGHPSLYGIVIALGQWLTQGWLSPLTSARFGPMMLFALAAGAMLYRLMRDFSPVGAIGGVAALLTMPRLFAHAHFASFDGSLTTCWMLAWVSFPPDRSLGGPLSPQGRWTGMGVLSGARCPCFRAGLLWGTALGAAMSCKFTGWLAPLPFVAYAMVYGNRQTARMIASGLFTALVMFGLLNPRLWHQPIDGMQRFFDLNLSRAGTSLDIPTLFFGTRYTQLTGLPWYNTLLWTGITVPVGTLVLAAIGAGAALRLWASDGRGVLLVLNWLTLIAVRALPGAPVHDAERLILPSFAFLAALAGLGCHFVAEYRGVRSLQTMALRTYLVALRPQPGPRPRGEEEAQAERHGGRFVTIGMALVFLGSASSLIWYAPQWLSYYNVLIGGLRGADAAGMEATYYWDALDNEVLAWLDEHTAPDEKIEFAMGSTTNLELMGCWGILKRRWRPRDPGRYRWVVVQRRPTFWNERDRRLVELEAPAFVKTIRPPTRGLGPWRLDVPLIEIFPAE